MNGKSNGNGKADKHAGAIGINGELVPVLSGHDAPKETYKTREPGYRLETAIEICKRIARGATLSAICAEPDMPSKSAFLDWVDEDRDGLADRYTRAREKLMDTWSDQIVSIADDQTADPNDRRVRIDTRKWLMSKLAYKRYGDKLIHSGDPENPVLVLHKAAGIEALTTAELAALDAFTQARLTTIDVTPTSVVMEPTGNETSGK